MIKLSSDIQFKDDQDILKQMEEAYLSNPTAVKYIKSLGIPEDKIKANIGKIFAFVCDLNYCKNCPGFKNCEKENPHLVTKIVYDYGYVDRQFTPCKKMIERIDFEKQFIVRDFPNDLLEKTFRDVDGGEQVKSKKAVIASYTKFIKNGDTNWLYINGATGTGRSYLASVIATDIARKDRGPIAYINSATRVKELSSISFKNEQEFNKKLDLLCNVPVLIIDDFGNEFKTDFVRDGIIFPILSKRSAKKLYTIFTSDFTIDEIKEMFSTSKAADIRATQIAKILKASCGSVINLGEIGVY